MVAGLQVQWDGFAVQRLLAVVQFVEWKLARPATQVVKTIKMEDVHVVKGNLNLIDDIMVNHNSLLRITNSE